MKPMITMLAVLFLIPVAGRAAEDLAVLQPTEDGVAPGKQLELWLKQEFYRQVDRRSEAFEKMIKSESACRAWQADRRAFFLRQIGGLPERTPLHPRIVGRLEGQGYRVEKILLESRPGFHVTANLYLPESAPPWPAVLIPCGHSHDGKAANHYQRASILLAKHGMAAICYDPIGQGERYQIVDPAGRNSKFEDAPHVAAPHPSVRLLCTTEHTMIGLGCALLGGNVAQYRIWDGMRVIDYLQSRQDIRADKIGCAGNSGGGTETSYLMALDDRIVAAAPGCYLTTFRRLIDSRGPQDGEQNICGQIVFGMDEADYCIMRAPRPTLICAGTRDVTFDFRGTWELFLDAKRFYSRIGRSECMDINAPDAPHGFTLQQREATARWMHRWLLGSEKIIREIDTLPDTFTDEQLRSWNVPDWTAEQLQCTPQGQVLLESGQRSAFQINADIAASLRQKRAAVWQSLSVAERRKRIREVIGARPPDSIPAPQAETVAKQPRDGYAIHKLVLTIDEHLRIPALGFVPARPAGPATLYLHGVGMAEDAAPGGPIEALVARGQIVLSAELRGIGETETGHDKVDFGKGRFGRDNLEIFLAYLIGKSYVGMRTEDVQSWTRFLRAWAPAGQKPTEIHLIAVGEAAIPALHAAALEDDAYRTVTLRRMLPSWEHIVGASETFDQWVNVVHGALPHYDLPDLIDLVGTGRVKLVEPADVMGRPREPNRSGAGQK
jgi:dienelactone hydrolase